MLLFQELTHNTEIDRDR